MSEYSEHEDALGEAHVEGVAAEYSAPQVFQSLLSTPWAPPLEDLLREPGRTSERSGVRRIEAKTSERKCMVLADVSGLSMFTEFASHPELARLMENVAHAVHMAALRFGVVLDDRIMGDDGKFGIKISDPLSLAEAQGIVLFLNHLQSLRIPTGLTMPRYKQLMEMFPDGKHKFKGNTVGLKVIADIAEAGDLKMSALLHRNPKGLAVYHSSGLVFDRLEALEYGRNVGEVILSGPLAKALTEVLGFTDLPHSEDVAAQINLKADSIEVSVETLRSKHRAEITLTNVDGVLKRGDKLIPTDFPYHDYGRLVGVPLGEVGPSTTEVEGTCVQVGHEVHSRLEDADATLLGRSMLDICLPDSYSHEDVDDVIEEIMVMHDQCGWQGVVLPKVDGRRLLIELNLMPEDARRITIQLYNALHNQHLEASFSLSRANAVVPVRIGGSLSLERDRGGRAMMTSPVMNKKIAKPGQLLIHGPMAAECLPIPVEWEHAYLAGKNVAIPYVVLKPDEHGRVNEYSAGSRELFGVEESMKALEKLLGEEAVRFIDVGIHFKEGRDVKLGEGARFGRSAFGRAWVRKHIVDAVMIERLSEGRYPASDAAMQVLSQALSWPQVLDVETALREYMQFSLEEPLTVVVDVPVAEDDFEMLRQIAARTPHQVKFVFTGLADKQYELKHRVLLGEKEPDDFYRIFMQNAVRLPATDRSRLMLKLRSAVDSRWKEMEGAHAVTPPLAAKLFNIIRVREGSQATPLRDLDALPNGNAWHLEFDLDDLGKASSSYLNQIAGSFSPGSPSLKLLSAAAMFDAPMTEKELFAWASKAFEDTTFTAGDLQKLVDEGPLVRRGDSYALAREDQRLNLQKDLIRIDVEVLDALSMYARDVLLPEFNNCIEGIQTDEEAHQAEAILAHIPLGFDQFPESFLRLYAQLLDYYESQQRYRAMLHLVRPIVRVCGVRTDMLNGFPEPLRLRIAEVLLSYEEERNLFVGETGERKLAPHVDTFLSHSVQGNLDSQVHSLFLRQGMTTMVASGSDRETRIRELEHAAAEISQGSPYQFVLEAAALYQRALATDASLQEGVVERLLDLLGQLELGVEIDEPIANPATPTAAMTRRRLAAAILKMKDPRLVAHRELASKVLENLNAYYKGESKDASYEGLNALHDCARLPVDAFLHELIGPQYYASFARGDSFTILEDHIEQLPASLTTLLGRADQFRATALSSPKNRYYFDALKAYGNVFELITLFAAGGNTEARALMLEHWKRFQGVHEDLKIFTADEDEPGFNDYAIVDRWHGQLKEDAVAAK